MVHSKQYFISIIVLFLEDFFIECNVKLCQKNAQLLMYAASYYMYKIKYVIKGKKNNMLS